MPGHGPFSERELVNGDQVAIAIVERDGKVSAIVEEQAA